MKDVFVWSQSIAKLYRSAVFLVLNASTYKVLSILAQFNLCDCEVPPLLFEIFLDADLAAKSHETIFPVSDNYFAVFWDRNALTVQLIFQIVLTDGNLAWIFFCKNTPSCWFLWKPVKLYICKVQSLVDLSHSDVVYVKVTFIAFVCVLLNFCKLLTSGQRHLTNHS